MDVCCQGGLAMGRRLFSEISREGLKFAFHSWGTASGGAGGGASGRVLARSGGGMAGVSGYTRARKLKSMYPFPLATEILK